METPATRQVLERLHADGLLDRTQLDRATVELRARLEWRLWSQRLLLLMGTCLTLAGIVFFFAYNWHAVSGHVKLDLAGSALLVCFVQGGAHRPSGCWLAPR